MKKFVKNISLFFLLICMITLTGCGKKESIDTKEFKSTMEKEGFTIYDSATAGASYGVKNAFLASSTTIDYQFELYEFETTEQAKSAFETHLKNVKDTYGESFKSSSASNYSIASLTSDEKYIAMLRIEDKCIYAVGPKDDETKIKKLMEKFGF